MKNKINIVLCLLLPIISKAECCGDIDFIPTTSTASISIEADGAKSSLRNALLNIPYVKSCNISVSGSVSLEDICCNETTIMYNGKKTFSANINAYASGGGQIYPPKFIDVTATMPGTECSVSLVVSAGVVAEISVSASMGAFGVINSCSNTNNISGSANATGTLSAGLAGEAKVTACGTEVSAKTSATGNTGVSGTVIYNSGSCTSSICFHPLTANIAASFCFLGYTCTYTFLDGYVLINGNC